MARKLIIDCDPGIGDSIVLCMALLDSRLEVEAITPTAGVVDAQQSNRNVQSVIEQIDPPKWPRLGTAQDLEGGPHVDRRDLHGEDGLGNLEFNVSELHRQHPSYKVIIDTVHNFPGDVTILALGPLTNIAAALSRDPKMATLVDRLIMTGGSVNGVGDITALSEFNMYADPESAGEVFRSPMTKTLIPLDVTQKLVFDFDFIEQLPDETTRVGGFLRRVMPHLFRSYRQKFGMEGIYIHEAVALIAALHPEFFETKEMAGDVEARGKLTRGTTVFDRRERREWGINMEVAVELDVAAVHDAVLQCLRYAGQETRE